MRHRYIPVLVLALIVVLLAGVALFAATTRDDSSGRDGASWIVTNPTGGTDSLATASQTT